MQTQSPQQLLANPHRQKQIAIIRDITSLPHDHWQRCYYHVFERLAALVQLLPASEYHHHAHEGGLLDHCLEVAAVAGSLRRGYTLPTGADPEVVRRSSEIWTFAAVIGALLHDVGKLVSDQQIEVRESGGFVPWYPWLGPLYQPNAATGWARVLGKHSGQRWPEYRMKFRTNRSYRHHEASALLLLPMLLDPTSLTWLNQFPDAFNAVISYLSGHKDRSELSMIITEADKASVAKALGGTTERALKTEALQSLHDKLVHALRFLVTEGKLPINRPGAAVWLHGSDVWLVSKTCMDAARAQMLSQGMAGVPNKNSVLFDELQDHNTLIPCGQGSRNAIWTATVRCGSWTQELTLIRLRANVLWPNGLPNNVAEIHVIPSSTESADANPPETAPLNLSKPPLPSVLAESTAADTPSTLDATDDPFAFLSELQPATALTMSQPIAPSVQVPPMAASDDPDDPFAFLSDMTDHAPALTSSSSTGPAPTAAVAAKKPRSAAARPNSVTQSATPTAPQMLKVETLLVEWLRDGIASGRIRLNEPKAKVHTVAGGLYLVTPGIFQEFMKKNPIATEILSRDANLNPEHLSALWKAVQKKFETLGWHSKAASGMNIHSARVTGAEKTSTLRGYFIAQRSHLLTTDADLFDNPHLTLLQGDES